MKRIRYHRIVSFLTLALLAILARGAAVSNEQPVAAANALIPDTDIQASIALLSDFQREALRQFPRIDSLAIDVNGAPAFVFGDLGRTQGSDAASVLEFLEWMRPFLNSERNDSYDHVSTELDSIGQGHYRFQQRINGLPVTGAVMIVHVEQATHRVVGLNGHIATGEVETMARLSASTAFTSAIEGMRGSGESRSRIAPRIVAQPLDEPALAYVLTHDGNARLVWRARFAIESEAGTEADTLHVDAATGELLLRENQYDAIYREIYGFGTQDWKNKPAIPGEIIFKEGGNLDSADAETRAVYPKLKTVYNWLKNRFNRNSFDGRDAKMKVSVHVPFGLSLWMGEHQAAFFMDATDNHDSPTKSLDTVAHEFGHGVNLSSAHLLVNTLEAGNLVEAFSDIMGACVEAYERGYMGGATDEATLHKVWSIGEDWWTLNDPSKPVRSLRNPKSCNDVNHQYVDYYPELPGANTTHEGSTVASLAFYLLAEGGIHPRNVTHTQVYGLGIPKAEQIFYRALTAYLTPFANFGDIRQCTHQAARDLYGSKSLEQAQVWYCWEAVGVPNVNLPSAREIGNGESIDPSLDRPGWQYFMLRVPSGQGKLEVVASGGFGDADLYVKRGIAPTITNNDQASEGRGVAKTMRINNPQTGLWYIAVHVRTPIGFSSLVARYSSSSGHVRLYEKENNNSLAKANRITGSNTTVVGRLYKYPTTGEPTFIDNDFFQISVPAGKTVFITMTCPPGYAYKTSVLDSNGNVLVEEAETLGSGDGKFKAIAFNNPGMTVKVIYAKIVPTDWNFSKIRFHCDPTKDYYLDITW